MARQRICHHSPASNLAFLPHLVSRTGKKPQKNSAPTENQTRPYAQLPPSRPLNCGRPCRNSRMKMNCTHSVRIPNFVAWVFGLAFFPLVFPLRTGESA